MAEKALDVEKLVDPGKWALEVKDDAERVVMRVFQQSAAEAADGLGLNADVLLDNHYVRRAVEARVRRIMSSTEARARQVADTILNLDASGADLDAIVDAVKGTMDQRLIWAATTARTETTGLVNSSALATAAAAGIDTKEWLSSRDEKVRHTHTHLGGGDGQTAPLGAPFIIGGFPLMYPGDPAGPPQECINCRCSLTFRRDLNAPVPDASLVQVPSADPLGWQRTLLHLNVDPATIQHLQTLADLRAGADADWTEPFDRLVALIQRHALLVSVGAPELAADVRGDVANVLTDLGTPDVEAQTILLALAAREVAT